MPMTPGDKMSFSQAYLILSGGDDFNCLQGIYDNDSLSAFASPASFMANQVAKSSAERTELWMP